MPRTRPDRCPGAWRPWPADDGLLVRIRLVGGRLPSWALLDLLAVAEEYGDGRVQLTARANLQVRRLPGRDGSLDPEVLAALEATGLLASRSHDLVRNVVVSPQTGLAGGRADLRPIARAYDALLLASPELAALPGRFLVVLDDGRGDVYDRPADLAAVALSADRAQLRAGAGWGPVLALGEVASTLASLARAFLDRRGRGPAAAWHLDELEGAVVEVAPPDPRLPEPTGPLAYGRVAGGRHVAVPDGLDRAAAMALAEAPELIVTPWRGVLVPDQQEAS